MLALNANPRFFSVNITIDRCQYAKPALDVLASAFPHHTPAVAIRRFSHPSIYLPAKSARQDRRRRLHRLRPIARVRPDDMPPYLLPALLTLPLRPAVRQRFACSFPTHCGLPSTNAVVGGKHAAVPVSSYNASVTVSENVGVPSPTLPQSIGAPLLGNTCSPATVAV